MTGSSDEFAYIHWLRSRTAGSPRVALGPGDDTAVVRWPDGRDCLVTTDMLLEGTCFRLAEAGPRRVGRKAMAVNLSDIAAMAGRPVAAVVSVGLPREGGRALAEELYRGLRDVADAFDTALVGGDTNSWDGPLVISVTVLGEPTGRGPVKRSGRAPGDWLMATGPFGGSILGHHLDFTPRVREAVALQQLVESASDDRRERRTGGRRVARLRRELVAGHDSCRTRADCRRGPPTRATADRRWITPSATAKTSSWRSPSHRRTAQGCSADQPVPGTTLHHLGEFVGAGLWLDDAPLEPRGYVHPLVGAATPLAGFADAGKRAPRTHFAGTTAIDPVSET